VPHGGIWIPGPRARHTVVLEFAETEDAIDIPTGAAGVVIRCRDEGLVSYRYVLRDRRRRLSSPSRYGPPVAS
jgi:hypothetical protein